MYAELVTCQIYIMKLWVVTNKVSEKSQLLMNDELNQFQMISHLSCGPFWASWFTSEEQIFEKVKCLFSTISHNFYDKGWFLMFTYHSPKIVSFGPCCSHDWKLNTTSLEIVWVLSTVGGYTWILLHFKRTFQKSKHVGYYPIRKTVPGIWVGNFLYESVAIGIVQYNKMTTHRHTSRQKNNQLENYVTMAT